MIAKYRKDGDDSKWWVTNFTMEQVEGRIADLERQLAGAKADLDKARDEGRKQALKEAAEVARERLTIGASENEIEAILDAQELIVAAIERLAEGEE